MKSFFQFSKGYLMIRSPAGQRIRTVMTSNPLEKQLGS